MAKDAFINNHWIQGKGSSFEVKDKYSGATIQTVCNLNGEQIESVIQTSLLAYKENLSASSGERSSWLNELADLLQEHHNEFVQLIVQEAGKPMGYSKAEVDRCISTLRIASREALTFGGEMVPMDFANGTGKTAYTGRFPIGPIYGISPFNFPLNLALHKIAPAIATGNSIIIKPSPYAPLSLMKFGEIIERSNIPKGLVNIVNCDIPEAEKILKDERIKMLSFTGSPQIGWHLKNIAGKKKVALELGGNAAVLVDGTTNLDTAASTCVTGAFLYSGQICISTQRIFVLEPYFEEFKKLLIRKTESVQSGDPTAPEVINGPLIDKVHVDRIHSWVQNAINKGAELLCGGSVMNEENNIYSPTILTGTDDSMEVSCEEVFGPVTILESVRDFESGLKRINDSNFGLQAGIFSNRIDHMKKAFQELEVGGVMMNNVPGFRIDNMPYGGVKDSGFGREGLKYAMEEMTEPKLLIY